MINDLNLPFNEVNKITNNTDFTIKDLINVLSKLDPSASVYFGVINERDHQSFRQDEDFLFELHCFTLDDEAEGNYDLHILTRNNYK